MLPVTGTCPYMKSSPLITGLSGWSKLLPLDRSKGLKVNLSLKASKYIGIRSDKLQITIFQL